MCPRKNALCSLSLVLLVLASVQCRPLRAQELVALALRGEGTSYVVIDDAARTAYVTDGGKAGAAGLAAARVGTEDVLDFLSQRRIATLVVTCTHPHDDHEEGLKALVRDKRILKFKTHFVDNGYEAANKESLFSLYRAAHKEAAAQGRADYASADNRDALGQFAAGKAVEAHNFVYEPGADIHDRSVVSEFQLHSGEQSARVVDFDDASSRIIRLWAGRKPPPKAEVLLVAHHGSRHNDLSPVLEQKNAIGIRDVVVTVNEANRFSHPSPEVLLRLLREFGPEHVLLTSGGTGRNVHITPRGAQIVGGRPEEVLTSFIRVQGERQRAAERSLLQTAQARQSGPLAGEVATALETSHALTPAEAARLRRVQQAQRDLAASLEIVEKRKGPPDVFAAVLDVEPLNLPRDSAEAKGPNGPKQLPDRTDGAESSGLGLPTSPGGGGGSGSAEGRRSAFERGSSLRGTRGVESYQRILRESGGGGRGGGGRGTVFRSAVRTVRAGGGFGGVIIGNTVDGTGVAAESMRWLVNTDEGAVESVQMSFHLRTGQDVLADPLTPTEAWSVYNIAHPSHELRARYQGVDLSLLKNQVGLVGIDQNLGDGTWTFGVHPAISDTFLARDAMRVDMSVSALDGSAPDELPAWIGQRQREWSIPGMTTYQWFDAPSTIVVAGDHVRAVPAAGPKDCLMRLQVITHKWPSWVDPDHQRESFVREALRRARAAHETAHTEGEDAEKSAEPDLDEILHHAEALGAELKESGNDSIPDFKPEEVARLCSRFDALAAVDRLAGAAALLRWFEQSGGSLPPLPPEVQPVTMAVPATWSMDRVFATAPVDTQTSPSPTPAPTATPIACCPPRFNWRAFGFGAVGVVVFGFFLWGLARRATRG